MIQEQIEQAIAQCWQNYSGLVINHGTGAKERCFTEAVKALLHDFSAALTAPSAGVGREFSIGFVDWLRSMNFHLVQRLPEFNIDQKQTRERFIELLDQYQTLSTQSRSASQPGVDTDNLRASIAEILKETEGYWQTCTGCHESEDGHDVGHYPFSDTFQCKLGSGCHECGGIGAVWEHYPDKTTDTDQSHSLPPDGAQGLVEALEKIVKHHDFATEESTGMSRHLAQIAQTALAGIKGK